MFWCSSSTTHPTKCTVHCVETWNGRYTTLIIHLLPCKKKNWAELDFADEINKTVAQDRSGSITMEILGRIEGAVSRMEIIRDCGMVHLVAALSDC